MYQILLVRAIRLGDQKKADFVNLSNWNKQISKIFGIIINIKGKLYCDIMTFVTVFMPKLIVTN